MKSTELLEVTTTLPDQAAAEHLAHALLDAQLAACVQVAGPLESFYWWQGEKHHATEFRCTIKTHQQLLALVELAIRQHHPYDEPEILATSVTHASPGYCRWVQQQVADHLSE